VRKYYGKVPDAWFLLVGDGPLRPQLEQKAVALGLGDRLRFLGFRQDLECVMALLDLFVLPSYANEGVPQALLQALAMERPVVATAVGGIPEVITSGSHGILCEPQNPTALAKSILEILKNPSRAKQMASAGRKRVIEQFSLESMVDCLEDVYFKFLDGKTVSRTPSLNGKADTSYAGRSLTRISHRMVVVACHRQAPTGHGEKCGLSISLSDHAGGNVENLAF
jgi:glycosyltransferase involved in cell wall biosynthesis